MDLTTGSLFSRIFSRPRPLWLTLLIGAVLLSGPVAVLLLDGIWATAITAGFFRPLFVASVIILYVLVIGPPMARSDGLVIDAFRPIIFLEEEDYQRVVEKASRLSPWMELLVFALGSLAGFLLNAAWQNSLSTPWLRLYVYILPNVMYGLLSWTIYASLASTRLTKTLLSQPMQLDIFDTRSFISIGRSSLLLALVFIGGITLSVLFGLDYRNMGSWRIWVFYIPIVLAPVVAFFLNMLPAHRVLANEKKRALDEVEQKIRDRCAELRQRLVAEAGEIESAAEFNALIAYETRLKSISTWPYNTPMLRTLSFSFIIPLLVRGISALLFRY